MGHRPDRVRAIGDVMPIENCGREAGLVITAEGITKILEDRGRGLPPRAWRLTGGGAVGSALVYFSTHTGKIATAVVSAGTAASEATAADGVATQLSGGRLVLRGDFVAAYDARDPDRSLIAGASRRVILDRLTGEGLSAN
jgi:hypothetical protein